MKNKILKERVCKVCGNKFNSLNNDFYCSPICKAKEYRKYSKYKPKEYSEKDKCKLCNKEFIKRTITQLYCSQNCRKEEFKKKRLNGFYDLNNTQWLKLRFEIFKRDNFTCKYCGRNVNEDNVKLNIDHIIPKNKNGNNNHNNLITSCFECNQGKKDILLEERKLLGGKK